MTAQEALEHERRSLSRSDKYRLMSSWQTRPSKRTEVLVIIYRHTSTRSDEGKFLISIRLAVFVDGKPRSGDIIKSFWVNKRGEPV